ncbi:MAG TPA: homoserine O-acetyltransferase [Chitinophagales bacterium]|nr:homoserine O-acetyltransferase [Chitinophagales bacterium]
MQHNYCLPEGFQLENGQFIPELRLRYHTYGKLNADRNNVIWVFHALTANAEPDIWWNGLFGEGNILDPSCYFIVCVNMPGSCYGSTGPEDTDRYGRKYAETFPVFTIRDMVLAYQKLRDALQIKKILFAIGGSMGGMQALEWAVVEPDFIENLVLLACNHQHSPWGIAYNAAQRMAIEADTSFLHGDGKKGLEAARAIAMLSYRNYRTFCLTQQHDETVSQHKAESYLRYQGKKLSKRFSAQSYNILTKSMDSHNIARNRGDVHAALQRIKAKTLVIGIDSDILFPVIEQAFLAKHIPGAALEVISSNYGHDGFLIESGKIKRAINSYFPSLNSQRKLCKTIL